MKISDYDYNLPEELIANNPPEIRGTSRLMILNKKSGSVIDKKYFDVVDYLDGGDLLVLNDTRVIKARLRTVKENGAPRELVVLEKHSFDQDWHRHRVMYRGKMSVGDILLVGEAKITVESIEGDGLAFVSSTIDLLQLADELGEVPLPPYMRRVSNERDVERYQTVWANEKGSVAAPTASLNMTEEIIDRLKKKGIKIAYITLHVGLGTFLPIRSDLVEDHKMHQEQFSIPLTTAELINDTKKSGKRVVALGTTVARTLEYASDMITNNAKDICGEADIFIYPGYKFRTIDGLMTNYHAPKSTVLMLTAAFAGWDKLLPAYQHAIDQKYNFLSYGDSMLII